MSTELTCGDFVSAIKCMSSRERNKIRLEDLINLIIQLPGDFRKDVSPNTDAKIEELTSAINFVRAQATSNTVNILI